MFKKALLGFVCAILLVAIAIPAFACEAAEPIPAHRYVVSLADGTQETFDSAQDLLAYQTDKGLEVREAVASPRYVPCPAGPQECQPYLSEVMYSYRPDGTVWAATYRYLCKFCGQTYEIYTHYYLALKGVCAYAEAYSFHRNGAAYRTFRGGCG